MGRGDFEGFLGEAVEEEVWGGIWCFDVEVCGVVGVGRRHGWKEGFGWVEVWGRG